jgi:hypothetical protein
VNTAMNFRVSPNIEKSLSSGTNGGLCRKVLRRVVSLIFVLDIQDVCSRRSDGNQC